ncbi:hypothetical protein BDR05DRAFT_953492 [Suillus weaverae]|nr:hypothetical protein BDR05DRAFT_953492 [Suillus weaverae]
MPRHCRVTTRQSNFAASHLRLVTAPSNLRHQHFCCKHIYYFFYPDERGNQNHPDQPLGVGDLIPCYDRLDHSAVTCFRSYSTSPQDQNLRHAGVPEVPVLPQQDRVKIAMPKNHPKGESGDPESLAVAVKASIRPKEHPSLINAAMECDLVKLQVARQGVEGGISWFGYDASSTRYLRKGWSIVTRLRPHAVIWLGDALASGCYVTSEDEYKNYMDEFKGIFTTDKSVPNYFVPGNRDVVGPSRVSYGQLIRHGAFFKASRVIEEEEMDTPMHSLYPQLL